MNFLPLSVRYFAGVLNQGVIFSDDAYVYWTLIYRDSAVAQCQSKHRYQDLLIYAQCLQIVRGKPAYYYTRLPSSGY